MKFVKLLLLGAVICGVVFIINLIGKITTSNTGEDDIIDIEHIEVLKPFIARYNKEWNSSKSWDTTLYRNHMREAADFKTAGEINRADYDKLHENISKDVLNRLVELLEADFRATELPEDAVRHNLEGINVVSEDRPADDIQVVKMRNAWQTYLNTKSFVQKSYSANSFDLGMNSDCTSWTPFSTHKNSELAKRDKYRDAKLYKEYFKNNSLLSKGLESVDSRVEACRSAYNRKIVNAIRNCYGSVPTFSGHTYLNAMRSATDESEWNKASSGFDHAWEAFLTSFRTRKRKISEISTKFKNEVSDTGMQKEVSGIASKYLIPSKPSEAAKPNFNN